MRKLQKFENSFAYYCNPPKCDGAFGAMERFLIRTASVVIVPCDYVDAQDNCTTDNEISYAKSLGKKILYESRMNDK